MNECLTRHSPPASVAQTEDLGEDPAGPDPWEAAVHNKVSGELGRPPPASGAGAGG